MIYGFDTDDEPSAAAALLVYVCWRSRDRGFRVTPEVWAQVERFVRDAAKRARSLQEFVETLKSSRRLSAPTLQPRYFQAGVAGGDALVPVNNPDGSLRYMIQIADEQRDFGTRIFSRPDHGPVLRKLGRETAWIIALVRDRLERERPIEQRFDLIMED